MGESIISGFESGFLNVFLVMDLLVYETLIICVLHISIQNSVKKFKYKINFDCYLKNVDINTLLCSR